MTSVLGLSCFFLRLGMRPRPSYWPALPCRSGWPTGTRTKRRSAEFGVLLLWRWPLRPPRLVWVSMRLAGSIRTEGGHTCSCSYVSCVVPFIVLRFLFRSHTAWLLPLRAAVCGVQLWTPALVLSGGRRLVASPVPLRTPLTRPCRVPNTGAGGSHLGTCSAAPLNLPPWRYPARPWSPHHLGRRVLRSRPRAIPGTVPFLARTLVPKWLAHWDRTNLRVPNQTFGARRMSLCIFFGSLVGGFLSGTVSVACVTGLLRHLSDAHTCCPVLSCRSG